MSTQPREEDGGIAVIGVAGRFPGANDLDTFWDNLREGVESLSFFTDEELLASGVSPAQFQKANYVKAKPILDDIESFDAEFFCITPREATLTDPQHRLFLECAWEAFEDAGHVPHEQGVRVGVFAAASKNTYLLFNLMRGRGGLETEEVYQILIGNEKDYISSRVSYKLNLRGPSLTVQTACSSSLVAVHMACQSLLNYECDMALVGGVAVDAPHKSGYLYHHGGILSPDGHCRAFDASAQGTVFGQGVGTVILRRLEDALASGDRVRAVIRGSAVNNDGAQKAGFTAPSVDGQAEVIAEAMAYAGVAPETISYVEAHGTGTSIGDPIEVAGLIKAFQSATTKKQYCAIGSVKTNIGHLNAAAGIAGLIKTLLSLEHRHIPPSLNFREPNPQINFEESPFYVNTRLKDWESPAGLLRAGVSSFGQGGTNAHLIVEEAPPPLPSTPSRPYHFLAISARSTDARAEAVNRLRSKLTQDPSLDLADVAYTLHTGREHFSSRGAVVCASVGEATGMLSRMHLEWLTNGVTTDAAPPLAFVLPHSTPDEFALPVETYYNERRFREELAHCVSAFDWPRRVEPGAVFTSVPEEAESSLRQLTEEGLFPPFAFAVQYSLALLWMAWGVKAGSFIGDGIGELVAACLSGSLKAQDAMRLLGHPSTTQDSLSNPTLRRVKTAEALSDRFPADVTMILELSPRSSPDAPARVLLKRAGVSECRPVSATDAAVEWGAGGSREAYNTVAALSALWLRGVGIDWHIYYEDEKRKRVPLPTYPFQRKRFWLEPERQPPLSEHRCSAPAATLNADGGEKLPELASAGDSPTPLSGTERTLTQIFESALGVEGVGLHDDFFSLGGDSLLAVSVLSTIRDTVGVELPVSTLFSEGTVKGLAALLDKVRDGATTSELSNESPDLCSEVILDPSIRADGALPSVWGAASSILLTGATGFVGAHLLSDLLRGTASEVFCLVRAATTDEAGQRLEHALRVYGLWREDGLRVTPVVGDLSAPLWGMTADAFRRLAGKVDAVIHCGARVDFVRSYRTLKPANVGGTHEALRFAAIEKLKPLHYISTIAVFESEEFAGVKEVREDDRLGRGVGFHSGYDASKWVSEQIVVLARERGLPVSVYRLSNVLGHSYTGVMLSDHIIARFIKGCLQLGSAPGDEAAINLIPVDAASRMVVQLSLNRVASGQNFHVVNPEPTPLESIVRWLQSRGYRITTRPFSEWRERLNAAGTDNVLKPLLPWLNQGYPFSNRLYDYTNAARHLGTVGIDCPRVNDRLLDVQLTHLVRTGYVTEPPLPPA